jgi:hypothetical protein
MSGSASTGVCCELVKMRRLTRFDRDVCCVEEWTKATSVWKSGW